VVSVLLVSSSRPPEVTDEGISRWWDVGGVDCWLLVAGTCCTFETYTALVVLLRKSSFLFLFVHLSFCLASDEM
jgi:hypothetical protein